MFKLPETIKTTDDAQTACNAWFNYDHCADMCDDYGVHLSEKRHAKTNLLAIKLIIGEEKMTEFHATWLKTRDNR